MALISKSIWQRSLLLSVKDFLSFVRQIFFASNVPDPVFSTRVAPSKFFWRFLCTLTSFVLFALFSVIFLHRSTRVSAKQTKGLLHRLPPASRKRCRKAFCSSLFCYPKIFSSSQSRKPGTPACFSSQSRIEDETDSMGERLLCIRFGSGPQQAPRDEYEENSPAIAGKCYRFTLKADMPG